MAVNPRLAFGTVTLLAGLTAAPLAYVEGVIPYSYKDPVGVVTFCVGETGPGITKGMRTTVDDCMRRLNDRLVREWYEFAPCLKRDVTLYEASALLSWKYNVGNAAACGSTLVRLLNTGAPNAQWCAQLHRWTKATKAGVTIELPGLVNRRVQEYRICTGRNFEVVSGGVETTAPLN